MAYKMVSHEWCAVNEDYRKTFILDSADDVANLPECCAGSAAMVADKDGAMYMVNASGEWKEV
jgi:hypothetical protein